MKTTILFHLALAALCSSAAVDKTTFKWKRNAGGFEDPLRVAESATVFEDNIMMRSSDRNLHQRGIQRSYSLHDFSTNVLALKVLDSQYGSICFLTTVAKTFQQTQEDLEKRHGTVLQDPVPRHFYKPTGVTPVTSSESSLVDRWCRDSVMVPVKRIEFEDPFFPYGPWIIRTRCIYWELDFILDKELFRARILPQEYRWTRNISPAATEPLYVEEHASVFEDHVIMTSDSKQLHGLAFHRSISFHDFTNGVLAVKHLDTARQGGAVCLLTTPAKTYDETVRDLEDRSRQGAVSLEEPERVYRVDREQVGETRSKLVNDFCDGATMYNIVEEPNKRPDYDFVPWVVRTLCIYWPLRFWWPLDLGPGFYPTYYV